MRTAARWSAPPKNFRLTLTNAAVETVAMSFAPDRLIVHTNDATGFQVAFRFDGVNPVTPATVDAAPPITEQEGFLRFISTTPQILELRGMTKDLRMIQASGADKNIYIEFGHSAGPNA